MSKMRLSNFRSFKDTLIPDNYRIVKGGLGATVRIDKNEINQVLKNMGATLGVITTGIARAIASIGVDVLANAQPRVPKDPGREVDVINKKGEIVKNKETGKTESIWYKGGKLRESGRAILQIGSGYKIVGRGNADGTIMANLRGLKYYLPTKRIGSSVQYTRENSRGEDIALWCHEELLPHDQRTNRAKGMKYARTPGTGPKYLEIPFIEKRDEYISFIKNLFSKQNLGNTIEKSTQIIQGTRTKYAVNRVKIINDKVKDFGYFGSYIRNNVL